MVTGTGMTCRSRFVSCLCVLIPTRFEQELVDNGFGYFGKAHTNTVDVGGSFGKVTVETKLLYPGQSLRIVNFDETNLADDTKTRRSKAMTSTQHNVHAGRRNKDGRAHISGNFGTSAPDPEHVDEKNVKLIPHHETQMPCQVDWLLQ